MTSPRPTEEDYDNWLSRSLPNDINPTFSPPGEFQSTIPYVLNHQISTFKHFSTLLTPTAPRIGSPDINFDIINQLLQWGRDNSAFIHPLLAFGSPDIAAQKDSTSTTNWGVYATERIPPDTILLSIPGEICIQPTKQIQGNNGLGSSGKNNDQFFYEVLNQCMKYIPPKLIHLFIALRLLFEYNRIETSFYSPLLRSQPLTYPYLDLLNPDSIYINPSQSPIMLQQHVSVIQNEFETFINSIMTEKYKNKPLFHHISLLFPHKYNPRSAPPSAPPSAPESTPLTPVEVFIKDLTWAYYTAISRSFGSPNESNVNSSVFVPILDMVNHNSIPNCVQYFEELKEPVDIKPIQLRRGQNEKENKNNQNSNNSSNLIPKFNVILRSGDKWIEPGEEIHFSYTVADYSPVTPPPKPYSDIELAEYKKILQKSFNITEIFHQSLLRIPYIDIHPEGLIGGKDNTYSMLNYGFFQWQLDDLVQLRFFRFFYQRSLTPGFNYLANIDNLPPPPPRNQNNKDSTLTVKSEPKLIIPESTQTDSNDQLPTLTYQDAPLKYILPTNYHGNEPIFIKRHMDIVQLLLTELDLSDITQFNWTGPDYYLLGFLRLLCAGGHYAVDPGSVHYPEGGTGDDLKPKPVTHNQSVVMVKEKMTQRTMFILDQIEDRIEKTRKLDGFDDEIHVKTSSKKTATNNNPKKGKNNTPKKPSQLLTPLHTKPKYTAIEYMTAFSEGMIDEELEYGTMIMLYIFLTHSADQCIENQQRFFSTPQQNTSLDRYSITNEGIRLYNDVQNYYRRVLEGDYIGSLLHNFIFLKKALISHGLKVLATRLGLDLQGSQAGRPEWLNSKQYQFWKMFD